MWLIYKLVFRALEGGLSTWLHVASVRENVGSGKYLDFSEDCERKKAGKS